MVGLGHLDEGDFSSGAEAVSADGSVIVGRSGGEAIRWTAQSAMVGLGHLNEGDVSCSAEAVSADGSVIVGFSASTLGSEAFIWDADNGIRSLQEVLFADFELDLAGWQLRSANAITPDGTIIVGSGISPDGNSEAWMAVVPEPSTFAIAALGLLGLLSCAGRPRLSRF